MQDLKDSIESLTGKSTSKDEIKKVTFQEFIFLLSSQALIQMGCVPNPSTGKTEKHLPVARRTIDILALLEEKTKGNLTGEEEGILRKALYDLRLRYVEAVKTQKK